MIDIAQVNFAKMDGLVPAVVQDAHTMQILMLGFMNPEALEITLSSGRVTFFSRSRGRIWTKGESSGHWLNLVSIAIDCDQDSLLVLAHPQGPTCHDGDASCFKVKSQAPLYWLGHLRRTIANRIAQPQSGSYTQELLAAGTPRMAQKVGEEAVEVVIAALSSGSQNLAEESVDLLYHLFVLLEAKGVSMDQLASIIEKRNKRP
jgi:phosphoribosyl-ATP pyrophosphohydrolase/phosphoribosyl-AMP cyclohydrolase